jgi:ribosome-associated protein
MTEAISETESPAEDPTAVKALECARAAIDKKAENVQLLDLRELSGFTDFFVICSGTSDRQLQSIADGIEFHLRSAGLEALSTEGYAEGRWILMDFGDVVVHIFLEALREYYDLESLWSDAPRVKVPSEFYGPGGSRLN